MRTTYRNIFSSVLFIVVNLSYSSYAQNGNIECLSFDKTENYITSKTEKTTDSLCTKIDTVFFIATNEFYEGVAVKDSIMAIIEYKSGIKRKVNGYYKNGQKYISLSFNEAGNCEGLDVKWHKTGQKFSQAYINNGLMEYPYLTWYSNGEPQSYSDNYIVREWYPSGKLKKEDKTIDITKEGGIFKVYYENGQLAIEFNYDCDKQKFIHYYENGIIRTEGYIKTSIWNQIGKWTEYYENGNKKIEMYYDENKPNYKTGNWFYWDKNGSLTKHEIYEEGKLIQNKEYIKMKNNNRK